MIDEDALTPAERALRIRGLCREAFRSPEDTAFQQALAEDYITRHVPMADIHRELTSLTARRDEALLGPLPPVRRRPTKEIT